MAANLTREFVLKKLALVFPDPVIAEQALRSLDYYGKKKDEDPRGVNIVHLAILRLCEGKLWRLRELVQDAKGDFRDVLAPAQSPEEWRFIERPFLSQPGGLLRAGKVKPKKKLSVDEKAAMKKRDHDQWTAWISEE